MPDPCAHLRPAAEEAAADGDVCARCLEEGTTWVALRVCCGCGHVGCCDSSPGKHARAHHEETGHPILRPLDPEQRGDWRWCYVDDRYVA